MFPLAGTEPPHDVTTLTDALTRALAEHLGLADSAPVTAEGDRWPRVDRLHMDLSGATVRPEILSVLSPQGASEPGPTVADLHVVGRPVQFEDAKFDVELRATDAVFEFGRDAQGGLLLQFKEAREGSVELSAGREEVAKLVLSGLRKAARPHGAHIIKIDLTLADAGPRTVAVNATIDVIRSFRFFVKVTAEIEVDDNLTATARNLSVVGVGMTGKMAVPFLRPLLAPYEGRVFPLTAWRAGDLSLRDLEFSVDDGLHVNAIFGQDPAS